MKVIQVTTKTKEQIAGDFAAVFKDVVSDKREKVTPMDRMAPYKKEILKLRRRGLSWNRIAAGMHDPRIGERVSAKLLRTLFAEEGAPTDSATEASGQLSSRGNITASVSAPAVDIPRNLTATNQALAGNITAAKSAASGNLTAATPMNPAPVRRPRLIIDPLTGQAVLK